MEPFCHSKLELPALPANHPKLLAPHWSFWNLHLRNPNLCFKSTWSVVKSPMFFLLPKPGANFLQVFCQKWGMSSPCSTTIDPLWRTCLGTWKTWCMVNDVQMMCKVRGHIMKQCNKHELICSSRTILICPDLCHERIIRPEALRQALYHLQQAGDQRSTLSCYPNNYGNPWGSRKEISQTWFDFYSSVNLLEGILECHPIRTG